jgi:hypothetical protein
MGMPVFAMSVATDEDTRTEGEPTITQEELLQAAKAEPCFKTIFSELIAQL